MLDAGQKKPAIVRFRWAGKQMPYYITSIEKNLLLW